MSTLRVPEPELPTDTLRRAGRFALGLAAVGLALSLPALRHEPARFAAGWLWGFTFVTAVALGCLFLVTLQHVTASVWSVGVRRVPELLARPLWLAGLLFVPLALIAWQNEHFHLFAWLDPHLVAHSPAVQAKAPYLSLGGFVGRGALYLATWALAATWFVGRSLAQDSGAAGPEATRAMRRMAAPFLVAFGFTLNFASYDWLMSLSPGWASTIFGVYVFAGLVPTSLAVTTLVVLTLDRSGRLVRAGLRRDHLYSLGALLFAFTCFWAYLGFSQFMLIWYANLPEETGWFHVRLQGGWTLVTAGLALLRFVAPFLLLLSRRAKLSRKRLAVVSLLVLAGQALDLYWLIMPRHADGRPALGGPELGPLLLMVGLYGALVARSFQRVSAVAVGDPLLGDARRFRLED